MSRSTCSRRLVLGSLSLVGMAFMLVRCAQKEGPTGPGGIAREPSSLTERARQSPAPGPSVPQGYVVELVASNLDGPVEVVLDKRGNVYVANEGQPGVTYPGTTVSRINKRGQVETYAVGFKGPSGLAFDDGGILFVSDDTETVYKVENGVGVPFATIPGNPNAIAFDDNGVLYVAPYDSDTIYRVSPAGSVTPFAVGFVTPEGLAFDRDGFLYVANNIPGTISKVAPDGTIVDPDFASTVIASVEGLAFDFVGELTPPPPPDGPGGSAQPRPWRGLFAVSFADGIISQIDENGEVTVFASGFNGPQRIVFSRNGDLYVSEFGLDPDFANRIWRISRRP